MWVTTRPQIWVGIDVGKAAHHACGIDDTGKVVFSQRFGNDQAAIEALIARADSAADWVRWAIDLTSPLALLLITVLLATDQPVTYVPGTGGEFDDRQLPR
jgi:transposase